MNSVGANFMIWGSPVFIALVGQQILPELSTSPSYHVQQRPEKAERVGMPMFRSMSVQTTGPSAVFGRGSPSPTSPLSTGTSCSLLPLEAAASAAALAAFLAAAAGDETEGSSASSAHLGPWCLPGAQHFAGRPVAAASLEPTTFLSPSRLISISLCDGYLATNLRTDAAWC